MADEQFVYIQKPDGGISRMSAAEFHADPHNFISQGLVPIAPDKVGEAIAARRAQKVADAQQAERVAAAKTLPGMAATAAEGLVSGAVDAVSAPGRAVSAIGSHVAGVADPLADMTGRKALETGAYVAGGQGLQGAQAAQEYAANQRTRAQENAGTAMVSSVIGQVAGSGGLSGLGKAAGGSLTEALGGGVAARIAGAGATAAVEGAPLGLTQAQDQAYIENRKLTGEQAMAAMGTGALLAGGLGAGAKGLEEVFGAVGNKAAALTNKLAGPASEEGSAAQKLLRTSDENVAKTVEGTLNEQAREHTTDYVRKAVNGEDLGAARRAVHEDATEALAKSTNDSLQTTKRLTDKIDDRGWKLSQVKAQAETFAPDALEQAQSRAAAIKADIRDTIAELGKDAPKTLKGLAEQVEKQELTIRGTNDPAKAYMGLDQMRRDLQTTSSAFETGAKRLQDVDAKALADVLRQKIGTHYDDTWQFLMDQGTWGKQGLAQQEVNTARSALIQAEKNALPHLASQVGDTYEGAGMKSQLWEANERKLMGTVQKLGTTEGAFAERQVNRYLDATHAFAEAAEKYGLDAGDKASVNAVRENATKLKTILSDASEKASSIDQAQAFMAKAHEGQGLLSGAALGHLVGGGPIGAALGVAAGAATNPAKFMTQRLMIEQMASKAESIVGKSLDGLFANLGKAGQAVKAARQLSVPTATTLELFQGKHATPELAYEHRMNEILAADANYGQKIRDNARNVFGTLADSDPHSVGAAVVATTKAIQLLKSKLPGSPINTQSLTPTASKEPPSRLEIMQFADIWAAVSKPMEVIKNIPNGSVTYDQLQAIKQVAPSFYNTIQQGTIERIQKLDQKGIEIPYHERQIIDSVLDLNGAGDVTLTARFAMTYGDALTDGAAQAKEAAGRPPPKAGPPIGQRMQTQTDQFLGGSAR